MERVLPSPARVWDSCSSGSFCLCLSDTNETERRHDSKRWQDVTSGSFIRGEKSVGYQGKLLVSAPAKHLYYTTIHGHTSRSTWLNTQAGRVHMPFFFSVCAPSPLFAWNHYYFRDLDEVSSWPDQQDVVQCIQPFQAKCESHWRSTVTKYLAKLVLLRSFWNSNINNIFGWSLVSRFFANRQNPIRRRHIALTSEFFVLLLSRRGEESRWS